MSGFKITEKIVIFAHVPPPVHGQSVMVESMLRGLEEKAESGKRKPEKVEGRGRDVRPRASANVDDLTQKGAEDTKGDKWRVTSVESQENHEPATRNSQPATRHPLPATREAQPDEVTVFHVDARVSGSLENVGGQNPGKLAALLGYCMEALSHRFKNGARTLYFIPAPPKASAIVRDVIVMLLLRPFFDRLILHWHAVGLGAWVEGRPAEGWPQLQGLVGSLLNKLCRPVVRLLLKGANPAIIVAEGNRRDARVFTPENIAVVANGIADLEPGFSERFADKVRRTAQIQEWLEKRSKMDPKESIRVLYLGQCSAQKGFFDALAGLLHAAKLRPELHWHLDVAGRFVSDDEEVAAKAPIQELEENGVCIRWHGFVDRETKVTLLQKCDILLFPSHAESFGLVAVEAICCGVPVIASDLPGIRAVLGPLGAFVKVGRPEEIGNALLIAQTYSDPAELRRRYEEEFREDIYHRKMKEILCGSGKKELI